MVCVPSFVPSPLYVHRPACETKWYMYPLANRMLSTHPLSLSFCYCFSLPLVGNLLCSHSVHIYYALGPDFCMWTLTLPLRPFMICHKHCQDVYMAWPTWDSLRKFIPVNRELLKTSQFADTRIKTQPTVLQRKWVTVAKFLPHVHAQGIKQSVCPSVIIHTKMARSGDRHWVSCNGDWTIKQGKNWLGLESNNTGLDS